ncbi:acyltransferase family protein [Polaromonas sp.]|uniref:acyltransferase family protein n=1 Tax=Polaromonas sp. TaxID=1869339 RepID=UPI0032656E14
MSGTNQSTKYRPDIDGLRALAVIPVILFHAGFTIFSGGYVGVDVFFVISGYLITTIIFEGLKAEQFSFSGFYYNRAKRILPALFFVLLLTLPVAVYLMLPNDLAAFGKSNVYALTFLANFYFRKSADYFAPSSDQLPLLHTWSLAVEEQYYLIFPVVLFLLWRFGRKHVFGALLGIFIVSFLLSILGARNFPVSNYYVLPTRAWELLAGALIVFLPRLHVLQRHQGHWAVREGLPLLGLLMIVFPVFAFDKMTPYPGPPTLMPVLGTVLIILFFNERGWAARLLSVRPLVFIGAMSYSLYLWHFPVFALGHIYQSQHGVYVPVGWLFALLVGMAYFSLVAIERPVRYSKAGKLGMSALFGVISALMIAGGWLLQDRPEEFKAYKPAQLQLMRAPAHDPGVHTWDKCSATGIANACEGGDVHAARKVILFGDSHSYTLFHGLSEELKSRGQKLLLITDGNCPPVFAADGVLTDDKCVASSRAIYKALLQDSDVDAIVLVARWSWYIHREPFDNLQGGVGEKSSNFLISHQKSGEGRVSLLSSLYEKTFRSLVASGIPTVVVNTIPEPGWNVPKKALYMLSDASFDQLSLSYGAEVFVKRNAAFDQTLAKFKDISSFRVVHPSSLFCNASVPLQCTSLMNGALMYADDNHLSYLASTMVSKQIAKALDNFQEASLKLR